WTAVMRGPKDHVIHWDGEYIEVSEPEKLSFTVSDQPGEDVYDLCTVELTDLAGTRTDMRFTQSGGHMPAEAYRRAQQGWSGFVERSAERLAGGSLGRRARSNKQLRNEQEEEMSGRIVVTEFISVDGVI